jgi:predicted nucleic acid-binding protein
LKDSGGAGVVDASAILPIVDLERCTPRAEEWLATARRRTEESITVDLFDVECANALWKRVRRELWAPRRAEQALSQILELPFRRVPLGTVVSDALLIAVAHGLSAYDACYVTLARISGLQLVTADRRMAHVARAVGCEALCFTEDLDAP